MGTSQNTMETTTDPAKGAPPNNDQSVCCKKNINSKETIDINSLLRIPIIATILTAFTYLVGRLYTEQYYGEFAVNYRSLQFDRETYMFNGWNVVSTGVLVLAAVWVLVLAIVWVGKLIKSNCLKSLGIALVLFIVGITIAGYKGAKTIVPFNIDTIRSFVTGTIWPFVTGTIRSFVTGSSWPYDVVIQLFCCGVLFIYLMPSQKEKLQEGERLPNFLPKINTINAVVLLFVLWVYFLVVTVLLAKYQVDRAQNGYMGTKITHLTEHPIEGFDDCWWLVVTETNNNLTLLYQPSVITVTNNITVTGVSHLIASDRISVTLDYPNKAALPSGCDLPSK